MGTEKVELEQRRRFVDALTARTESHDGIHKTPLKGVELWKLSGSIPRHPAVYDPKIVFIAQGKKVGYLADEVYPYDPHNYLVLPVPLPFECETIASREAPLLGLTISLDISQISELLLQMDEPAGHAETPVHRGMYSSPFTPDLLDVLIRLAELLASPENCRVLGLQTVREIIYRVLQGEHGQPLRGLIHRDDHFTRIAGVIRMIQTDYAQTFTTEMLARQAGMSVSVFHETFKFVTATSPLQYVKRVRLHRAHSLMTHSGMKAGAAATTVGYESQSQFGREFKRVFGVSPLQQANTMRKQLQPTV